MHRKPIRPLRGHINNTTIWKGRRFACQARCVCSAVAYWRNNSCLKFTPAPAAASSLLVAQEDSKTNSRSHLKNNVQRPKASWLLSESDHFRRSDALIATSACTTSAPREQDIVVRTARTLTREHGGFPAVLISFQPKRVGAIRDHSSARMSQHTRRRVAALQT
jgi:hypothetical protein